MDLEAIYFLQGKADYFSLQKIRNNKHYFPKSNYFSFLPPELILHTFNFLEGYDLLVTRAVCKLFFDIITEYIKVHVTIKNECNHIFTIFKKNRIRTKIFEMKNNLFNRIIHLKNLEYMFIYSYHIVNTDFRHEFYTNENLVKFPFLKYLNIDNTTDIRTETLLQMTQVEEIVLADAKYIDYTCLNKLTNLTALSLYNAPECSDDVLSKLTNLKKLKITVKGYNLQYVTDKSVSLLTNLELLNLSYCDGITVESLIKLNKLRELILTNIYSIKDNDLKHLRQLKTLTLFDTIIDGKGLKYLSNLEELRLYDNLYDFKEEEFSTLTHLKKLYLGSNCSRYDEQLLKKILPNVKVTSFLDE